MAVDILLATYNGGKFLSAQINSVLNQTYKDWHLLISDDRSNDATVEIVSEYIKRYPRQIKLFINETRLGSCQNFNRLLQISNSDHIMFCDQDDIWLPNKIELSLKEMVNTETKHPGTPILIHTDLKIINEKDIVIADSFWETIKLNPDKRTVNDVLGTCNTNGNTILINKKLKDIIGSIPDKALMHDWWSAIVAAQFGLIVPLKKQTVLYRQHPDNAVGAVSIINRLPQAHIYLGNIYKQILEFERIYNLHHSIPKIFFYKFLSLAKNYLFL